MQNQQVFEYLRTIGVCKTCCLRYMNVKSCEYLMPDLALEKRNLVQIESDHQLNKKQKNNVCVACLNILDPANIEHLIEKIAQSPELTQFQCDSILTSISLPIALHLRQLSLWLDLIRKFDFIDAERAPDVPLKEVIKLLVNPRICEATKREWDRDQTGIVVNIVYTYDKDTAEMELLQAVNPDLFRKPQKGHKRRKDFMTRNAFEKSFTPTLVDKGLFFQHCPCPPETPSVAIFLEEITFTGPTVFLAGRYRKMSRELSQTPWVLNGTRKMESSVQELITEVVAPHFKVPADTMLFSSSGREDVDVRCLGRGRPFVLEIQNSFATTLPPSIAGQMEAQINQSDKISVLDLQMVKREDLVHIKHGEEKKKKFYRALCYLEQPVTVETLRKLDLPEGFTIQQPTPLRVLHRRPLLTRPRQIFGVKAWAVEKNKNCIILDVQTQAGTYVKELVTGEFGRTSPSIASVIGQFIDIIALDVVAIDLDWPPAVGERTMEENLNKIN